MTSLTNIKPGTTCTIQWMPASRPVEEIFAKIGLCEGMPIHLIQNFMGDVVVRYGNHIYGMSNEVASRIKVS